MVEQTGKAGPSVVRLLVAASAGDQQAVDAVVAKSVPLVYAIVARTFSSPDDVDLVVEDLMIRVVRDIPELRDPRLFRSCLVAGAIDQIRAHRKQYRTGSEGERFDDAGVSGEGYETAPPPDLEAEQREELEHAARWLDHEDRELLALWRLARAGHLSAAEVTGALGVDTRELDRRVARLTERLDAARLLVRALVAVPVCRGLDEEAYDWAGRPTPAWRKRFFRHVGTCPRCCRAALEMLPIDELVTGPALLPLPPGYTARVIEAVHEQVPAETKVPKQAKASGSRWRFFGAKPVVVLIVVAAACTLGGSAFVVPRLLSDSSSTPPAGPEPLPTVTASLASLPSAEPGPGPESSAAPAPPPGSPPANTPAPAGDAERVLALMNKARAAAGLPPLKMDSALVSSALAHSRAMSGGCGLSHQCSGEAPVGDREREAGVQWMDAGENVGTGGDDDGLTQDMLNEQAPDDGHRRNILSPSFARVGVAETRDPSGKVWLTQDFAN